MRRTRMYGPVGAWMSLIDGYGWARTRGGQARYSYPDWVADTVDMWADLGSAWWGGGRDEGERPNLVLFTLPADADAEQKKTFDLCRGDWGKDEVGVIWLGPEGDSKGVKGSLSAENLSVGISNDELTIELKNVKPQSGELAKADYRALVHHKDVILSEVFIRVR